MTDLRFHHHHHARVDMRYQRVVRLDNLTPAERAELEPLVNKSGFLFFHPAHGAPMKPVEQSFGWTCIVCGYHQATHKPGQGERRGRYVDAVNTDNPVSICDVDMKSEYWPWEAKQTQLARGDVIPFYGFKRLGQLMVDEPWPSPDDQQGYLQILDEAMLRKIMPWRGTEPRQVLLSLQKVVIHKDTGRMSRAMSNGGNDTVVEFDIRNVISMTYIEDEPNYIVAIVTSTTSGRRCHFLTTPNAEMGLLLVDTFLKIVNSVYSSAVLMALDDAIAAGNEGRPTHEQAAMTEDATSYADLTAHSLLRNDPAITFAAVDNIIGIPSEPSPSHPQRQHLSSPPPLPRDPPQPLSGHAYEEPSDTESERAEPAHPHQPTQLYAVTEASRESGADTRRASDMQRSEAVESSSASSDDEDVQEQRESVQLPTREHLGGGRDRARSRSNELDRPGSVFDVFGIQPTEEEAPAQIRRQNSSNKLPPPTARAGKALQRRASMDRFSMLAPALESSSSFLSANGSNAMTSPVSRESSNPSSPVKMAPPPEAPPKLAPSSAAPQDKAANYVGNFMSKLQAVIPARMPDFAAAITQYRRSSEFGQFSEAMLQIVPKAHRALLVELRPMIRQEHKLYFQQFVQNFCDPSTMSVDSLNMP
eukprot:TRINITY_DN27000_c0_g1_i1.p1 TRINITY_DN27000_c0_g1~~TRINITY_DN27000_c0_g1_i1.p1  ORF type:complete len:646 (+),score=151.31 TRINITY_DN27000_c0_g1_i1:149-2086(+)